MEYGDGLSDRIEGGGNVRPLAEEDPVGGLLAVLSGPGAHPTGPYKEAPIPTSVVCAEYGFLARGSTAHGIGVNPSSKSYAGRGGGSLVDVEGDGNVFTINVDGVAELTGDAGDVC